MKMAKAGLAKETILKIKAIFFFVHNLQSGKLRSLRSWSLAVVSGVFF